MYLSGHRLIVTQDSELFFRSSHSERRLLGHGVSQVERELLELGLSYEMVDDHPALSLAGVDPRGCEQTPL